MTTFTRYGWAIVTDTLCGPYVSLEEAEDRNPDGTIAMQVTLHDTEAEAIADVDDCYAMERESWEDDDERDPDEEFEPSGEVRHAYVGIDTNGDAHELDPETREELGFVFNRGDR